MLRINFDRFNALEHRIHGTLCEAVKVEENIKINRAAEICGCTASKVSKFVRKTGFASYKDYIGFLYGDAPRIRKGSAASPSTEMERIRNFVDTFDIKIVDEFIVLLNKYDKIILFGYGPSLICAQYFEYKLRIVTSKAVMTAPDEATARTLLDDKSLLIVFSTTGKFASFGGIFDYAKEKSAGSLLIAEEYNTSLLSDCEQVIYLTIATQNESYKPYEKSRIVFFIFIEEVVLRLMAAGGKG